MTSIYLTEEQRRVVTAEHGRPIGVIDPATDQAYVLIDEQQFERIRNLIERPIREFAHPARGTSAGPTGHSPLPRGLLAGPPGVVDARISRPSVGGIPRVRACRVRPHLCRTLSRVRPQARLKEGRNLHRSDGAAHPTPLGSRGNTGAFAHGEAVLESRPGSAS